MADLIIPVDSGTGIKWRVRWDEDKFIAEYEYAPSEWRKSNMMPKRVRIVLEVNQRHCFLWRSEKK